MTFRTYPSLLLMLVLSGCASTGTAVKQPKLPSARLISAPNIDVTRSGGRPPSPIDITYEVVIRPDGSPDLSTIQILGTGASEIRNALTEWIGASRFEPSKLNGVPVMSIFKGGLRSSVRVM